MGCGQVEIPVIVARQCHADTALEHELVAKRPRQCEREVLFLERARARARIVPAVAGVDDHQRSAGIRRSVHAWQPDPAAGRRKRDPDDIVEAAAASAEVAVEPHETGDDRDRKQEEQKDEQALRHLRA